MGLRYPPSSVGWCCLVSSSLGVVFLSFYVVLLGFFLFGWSLRFGGAAFMTSFGCRSFFPCLLLGGAVWVHPSFWIVLLFSFSCLVDFVFLLLLWVGAALSPVFSCWVVLLGLLLPWRCFPLLLRGAAWCLPSLGGVAVLFLLFGLCCLPSPPLGGACFIPRLLLEETAWSPPTF